MTAVRVTYLITSMLLTLGLLTAGAYFSTISGDYTWGIGALVLVFLSSYPFTKRVNSWNYLGKV